MQSKRFGLCSRLAMASLVLIRLFRSLAQSALRLEEIHQSLRCNVFHTAHEMQVARVSKSIHHLQQTNAGLQKQIQVLKQRVRRRSSLAC